MSAGPGNTRFGTMNLRRGEIVHNILNFDCVSPLHFNPTLPSDLSSVILRLLRKNRDERYLGHKDLKSDLTKLMKRFRELSSPKRGTDRQVTLKNKQKGKTLDDFPGAAFGDSGGPFLR